MINFKKIGLNYDNIILKHNFGIVNSRSECDISVKIGGVELSCPVFLSNMRYLQEPNPSVLEIFNQRKWGYSYHRLGGYDDILSFTRKINKEDWHLKCISIGIKDGDWELLNTIKKIGYKLDVIVIDVAFIYNQVSLDFVKKVRHLFPDIYLIAGNFDQPATALALEKIGVDCGKFGIGISKKCRTRQRISIGTSIITDLISCKEKTKKMQYMVDGGLKVFSSGEVSIGDCWKAMNFGADFVNSASLFQRVTELTNKNGEILCYGNSTPHAKGGKKHDEGTIFTVKTDGKSLNEQMDLIEDSCRSFCSYAGIKKITNSYNSCDYQIVF